MDKQKQEFKYERIELRSEKMKKILDEIPRTLIYSGMTLIIIFFALIITIVMFMKFPYGNGETIFEHIFMR